jgi:rhodanese-related sulfurtransferase
MKYKLLSLICFVVLSTSCQTTSKDSTVKVINNEELKSLLKNDDVQFVDVRTEAEFNENHIKGSKNIVYDSGFGQKIDQLDKDKPVAVYCRSGRRSAASASILEQNGFTKIYNLDGGILKWMKEGNEVE